MRVSRSPAPPGTRPTAHRLPRCSPGHARSRSCAARAAPPAAAADAAAGAAGAAGAARYDRLLRLASDGFNPVQVRRRQGPGAPAGPRDQRTPNAAPCRPPTAPAAGGGARGARPRRRQGPRGGGRRARRRRAALGAAAQRVHQSGVLPPAAAAAAVAMGREPWEPPAREAPVIPAPLAPLHPITQPRSRRAS
jgi:hypothetical protein